MDTATLREMLMDVARTVVKSFGGALIAGGYLSQDQLTMLAGAAAVLVGLIWSWVSTHYLTEKKA